MEACLCTVEYNYMVCGVLCSTVACYQSAEAASPAQRVPRRAAGTSGPETNDT